MVARNPPRWKSPIAHIYFPPPIRCPLSLSLSLQLWLLPLPPPKQLDNRAIRPARYLVAMAWLEQCEVCGGGGFFCCHRSPDLNQAAAGGGRPGVLQEFQFFGRKGGGGGVAWLANGADAGDTVSDDRTPAPLLPVAPTTTAAWEDTDCRRDYYSPRWPTLESCSMVASLPEPATGSSLVDASNLGPVLSAAATTTVSRSESVYDGSRSHDLKVSLRSQTKHPTSR